MFRTDRNPRGEDPLLLFKMALFFAAATVAVIGMATQRQWVIFAGIVILGIGFLLRFLRPKPQETDAHASEPEQPQDDTRAS